MCDYTTDRFSVMMADVAYSGNLIKFQSKYVKKKLKPPKPIRRVDPGEGKNPYKAQPSLLSKTKMII